MNLIRKAKYQVSRTLVHAGH